MRGAPWQWRAEAEAEVENPIAKAVEKPLPEAEAESQIPTQKRPQRVWIMRHDVENRGMTRGCGGCKAAIDGRKGHKHTESCRARFVKEFEQTVEGRKKKRISAEKV